MIGWLGILLTATFGVVTLFQFGWQLIRWFARKSQYNDLLALKKSMMQLRFEYTEAVAFAGVIESKAQQQFIKGLGHHVRTAEHFVDGMLESWPATKNQQAKREKLFAICAGVREPEKKSSQPPN